MPHPATALSCLNRCYCNKSQRKGGTLIADGVLSLEEHRKLVADPDAYRPSCCPTCKNHFMHAHSFRTRLLRGDPESPCEDIRRYRCPACGAIWQVLPACIARCLHRRWTVIQSALVQEERIEPSDGDIKVRIPSGTLQRWISRIRSSASVLVNLFTSVGKVVAELKGLTADCTRAQLLDILAGKGLIPARDKLATLSCWIHHVAPGIRVL